MSGSMETVRSLGLPAGERQHREMGTRQRVHCELTAANAVKAKAHSRRLVGYWFPYSVTVVNLPHLVDGACKVILLSS